MMRRAPVASKEKPASTVRSILGANRELTRGAGWAYKRGPSVAGPWGLLFEIVEKMGRDARTAAEGRLMFAHRCERLEALDWVYL
jgi:hypothetical protein